MFFGWVLQLLGSGVVDSVLKYFEKKADNDTERARIQSVRDTQIAGMQADVIKTGMSHKVFWVAWGMAAIPMCAWFGYGMINTMFTSLPHVAEIPPGLLEWAKVVWGNVFFSGAGVVGATVIAQSIRSR